MMPANHDLQHLAEQERVRQILEPQGEEARKRKQAAMKAAEQRRVEAQEQRKTSNLGGLLLLALLETLLFAGAHYLFGPIQSYGVRATAFVQPLVPIGIITQAIEQ